MEKVTTERAKGLADYIESYAVCQLDTEIAADIRALTKERDDLIAANKEMADDLVRRHDRCCALAEQLAAAQAAIPVSTKRDSECKTADDWRHKAMYYESQWSQCSYGFNKVAGELRSKVDRLEKELAAAQAVNVGLREALDKVWLKVVRGIITQEWAFLAKAINTQSDDTALRQLLEAQREAAASLCEKSDRYRGDYFAALIRTMPLIIDTKVVP